MHFLVTGGAGFIGSNIVSLLVKNGHLVTIIDNLSKGSLQNLEGLKVNFIDGDIRDQKLVSSVMQKNIDGIFHLAALISTTKSIEDPLEDCSVNALGTANILHYAVKENVRKLVYSSSAAIFGELKGGVIDESHPLEPISPYGVSKLAGEKYCFAYAKSYPISVVALRYFNVYGVNQRFDEYGNVIPIFAKRLLEGKPLTVYGDGEQTRDFINVKDVASANYLAMISNVNNCVYNVGSGSTITINELSKLSQQVSGIQADIHHAPERVGEIRHCCANTTKIINELGFKPSSNFEKGLKEYFDWYRS